MALSLTTTTYSQDFDTLASSGTSSSLPAGWAFLETGTNANLVYAAGTGSSNAGDTYSFGAAGSTERALGGLLSGSLIPTIGFSFSNDTGATITAIQVAYTGEQWRLGATGRTDRLDFQYSLDATSLNTGTWTNVDTLDFNAPKSTGTAGALNGNLADNRAAVSDTLSGLNIAAGATVWIRFVDANVTSSDDGLAIDDFSLTLTTANPQPTLTLSAPDASAAEGGDSGSFRITRTGPTTAELTVGYTLGGSASAGDYSPVLTGTLTIPAGASSADIVITPVDDTEVESPETLTLTLGAVQGYTLAGGPATVTIADNDTAVTVTQISTIQGSTGTSPLAGSTVTLEAIVVADLQSGMGGFFVQEEDADADADPLTSEGLFIFNSAVNVNVGDKVRITGTVIEFSSSGITLTEISPASSITVLSSGNTLPTAAVLDLPVATVASLEAFEGMRVTVPETLTVTDTGTDTDGLQRFGEVLLAAAGGNNEPSTDARLDQFTQFHAPSVSGNAAYQAQNALRSIVLDDGSTTSYPGSYLGRDGLPLSATNTLRGGDTVTGLTGVLDQRFGAYRIQPTQTADFDATNARPTTAPDVGGTIQVAAMNVLNYFNGPSFPTSRGADTATELARQQAKIVSAILGTGAEVVGLMEIENDGFGPSSAIQTLVNALNAATAPGTWAFINPGSETTGTDEIMVGLIYQPAAVTPVGAAATLSATQDPLFSGFSSANRPALAQTFRVNDTGGLFTPVINHLKSKGSSAGGTGDADIGDGQAASNGTRTRAAEALVDWLATDPTGQGDTDYLILGDLNAYAQEDPIKAIERGADNNAGTADDWANLIANSTYSYSFDGQWGALDHALGSASIVGQVTGATKWHINADEPVLLDYNTELGSSGTKSGTLYNADPYRASDHDPVVVGLDVGVTLTGTKQGDLIVGTSGADRIAAGQARDGIYGGGGRDTFVVNSLLDFYDTIFDFVPGVDRLDISGLLASLPSKPSLAAAISGGYVTVSSPVVPALLPGLQATVLPYTLVLFDLDGSAGSAQPRPMVELIGTAVTDVAQLLGLSA